MKNIRSRAEIVRLRTKCKHCETERKAFAKICGYACASFATRDAVRARSSARREEAQRGKLPAREGDHARKRERERGETKFVAPARVHCTL